MFLCIEGENDENDQVHNESVLFQYYLYNIMVVFMF